MTIDSLKEFRIHNPAEDGAQAIVGRDTDYKLCACGCGLKLPLTYRWAYKKGHKLAAQSGQVPPDYDPPQYSDEEIEKATTTEQVVQLTEEMKNDIQGQLAFIGSIVSMIWGSRDPICAGQFIDNIDNISEKAIPIIAKSPRAVAFMLKQGGLMDYLALGVAMKPVFSTWVGHHITHTIAPEGDRPENYSKEEQDFSYPIG